MADLRRAVLPRHATSRARHFAMLVTAVFAILSQSVLVQAHRHAHWDVASIARAATHHVDASHDGSGRQDETDCPICREMAHAGAFVLPEDPVLHSPEPSALWRGTRLDFASVRNSRSHAWRSRAPPLAFET